MLKTNHDVKYDKWGKRADDDDIGTEDSYISSLANTFFDPPLEH